MSQATYFLQRCPTCGRQLQVRVEYLGRKLSCEHCQGSFVAAFESACGEASSETMTRADQLLVASERPQQ
jgi:DNA-directed RNA polymerase subunit RPC12/RpoP